MGLLDGKVAIVTGAGSVRGQGAAAARLFVAEGARAVVLADLPSTDAAGVAREIGEAASFVALDVTDAQAWDAAVAHVASEFGTVDVLVNNAGVWLDTGLAETTPEQYRRVVEINQTGVFLGMRAVVPVMRKAGKGAIVNTSSTSGLKGGGMPHAYAASKWAVRGMTRAAAWELAPDGIRVNTVCPGFIDTAMIQGGREALDHLAGLTRIGRVGTPDEVARVVAFLASDASSYVSGAEIAIDAAYTA